MTRFYTVLANDEYAGLTNALYASMLNSFDFDRPASDGIVRGIAVPSVSARSNYDTGTVVRSSQPADVAIRKA